jgi:hypothetical protein
VFFLKSLCGNWLFRSPFVHIFSFEDPLKEEKRKKKKEKEKKKKRKREKGLIFAFKVSCSYFQWCAVILFVSRLVSLAQSRLGPT